MEMLAHQKGGKDSDDSPSKEQAKEFVAGQSPKGLPERASKKPLRKKRKPFYPEKH
jgi:hypothetical protein